MGSRSVQLRQGYRSIDPTPGLRGRLILATAFLLPLVSSVPAGGSAGGRPEPRHVRAQPPVAPWQWERDGQPVGDESWRSSDGPFGAMLLLTDDPEPFLEAFARPSPGHSPSLHQITEVERGRLVAAMIVFARCTPDPSGNCRSEVDFRVLRPDGSIQLERRATPLWQAPPPPHASLQLGGQRLAIEVGPEDPLGVYLIEAVVRDRVSGRHVSLAQELVVVEPARP